MGRNARQLAEKELNPEKHYERLMVIYRQAVGHEIKYEEEKQ